MSTRSGNSPSAPALISFTLIRKISADIFSRASTLTEQRSERRSRSRRDAEESRILNSQNAARVSGALIVAAAAAIIIGVFARVAADADQDTLRQSLQAIAQNRAGTPHTARSP